MKIESCLVMHFSFVCIPRGDEPAASADDRVLVKYAIFSRWVWQHERKCYALAVIYQSWWMTYRRITQWLSRDSIELRNTRRSLPCPPWVMNECVAECPDAKVGWFAYVLNIALKFWLTSSVAQRSLIWPVRLMSELAALSHYRWQSLGTYAAPLMVALLQTCSGWESDLSLKPSAECVHIKNLQITSYCCEQELRHNKV